MATAGEGVDAAVAPAPAPAPTAGEQHHALVSVSAGMTMMPIDHSYPSAPFTSAATTPWDQPQSYNGAFQAEMMDVSAGEFEALSDTGAFCILTGRRDLFKSGLRPCSITLTGFKGGEGMTITQCGPATFGFTTEDGKVNDIVCTGYYYRGYARTILSPGEIARECGGLWVYRPPPQPCQ